MFEAYSLTMKSTISTFPRCELPFKKLPFAAFTFNLGDQCCSKAHYDQENVAIGWCLVTPFGIWDHRLGGHIILHELKLIIEFPPGSSLLLPSALVQHENIGLSSGESRAVITAYTSGSFFRFADKNFTLRNKMKFDSYIEEGAWDHSLKRLPLIFSSEFF